MAHAGSKDVQVTEGSYEIESEHNDEKHRRRIVGITLPAYFNTDKEHTVVRKLDTFILYV